MVFFFIGKTSRFYFVIFPEKAEEEVWGKGKIKNNVKKYLLERKLKNLVSSNLKQNKPSMLSEKSFYKQIFYLQYSKKIIKGFLEQFCL